MTFVRTGKRKSASNPEDLQLKQSVLVVEDQVSLSQLLASMVESKWGADVFIANTYKEAEEILQERASDFHVAICDLNLPDSSLGEIIDLMNHHNVPSVALTGSYDDDLRESMLKKSVVDYVSKQNINSYEYVANLVGRLFKNISTKILIADDSVSAISVLKHMLELQQFQVLTAADGNEALQMLEKNPDIKMIVTDYNMPIIDGFELTLEIRKEKNKEELAIIGVSSSDDENIIPHFMKNGANDFLKKPYSYDELLCRIHQNLETLEYISEIRKMAYSDFLTKLHNRRYFFVNGKKIYQSQKDSNGQLASVIMDIDHFKLVNDNYGHDTGDLILTGAGQMLTAHFQDDLVARLGGEEFGILIKDASENRVRQKLENFREKISQVKFEQNDKTISITMSIGFTLSFEDDLDKMLKKADKNLYQAKEDGRNRTIG